MTQEEKHVELLKAAYQKWHDSKAGSVDYWLGLMTDDIKFRSLGAGAGRNRINPDEHVQRRSKALLCRAHVGLGNDPLPHR